MIMRAIKKTRKTLFFLLIFLQMVQLNAANSDEQEDWCFYRILDIDKKEKVVTLENGATFCTIPSVYLLEHPMDCWEVGDHLYFQPQYALLKGLSRARPRLRDGNVTYPADYRQFWPFFCVTNVDRGMMHLLVPQRIADVACRMTQTVQKIGFHGAELTLSDGLKFLSKRFTFHRSGFKPGDIVMVLIGGEPGEYALYNFADSCVTLDLELLVEGG